MTQGVTPLRLAMAARQGRAADGERRAEMAVETDGLLDEAKAGLDEVVALRRAIHAEPELGLDLPLTQAKVLDALQSCDVSVSLGTRLSSVVATMEMGSPGPTVLLRADMDALAIDERTGSPFASRFEQRMHACGHDAHTAMLVGAAKLLAARRHTLAGTVTLFFQPGEEGRHGAQVAIEEVLLDGSSTPDPALALHAAPGVPAVPVATRPGPIMAEATTLRFTMRGRGAHAARPHCSIDPLPAMCQAVLALQTLVAREADPDRPAVLSVTGLRSSSMLANVIPDSVDAVATLRTVGQGDGRRLAERAAEVVEATAAGMRCTAEVEIVPIYPVTHNDTDAARLVLDVARRLLGDEAVVELPAPRTGSEDFGYILQSVPGAFAFLGMGREGEETMELHSPRLVIDEDAMAVGVAMHAAVAMQMLSR